MPIVQPTEVTSEGSKQQLDNQEALQANVLDKIKGGNVFKSLDLPDDPSVEKQDPPDEIQTQEEEQTQEEQTQEESQEETNEEVIPKSKVQARFDQLTAQNRRLEQKLADLEKSSAPTDDIQRQLDAMTEDNLEDTLIQTRVAKEQSRTDPAKLAELVKLERRIEKTIATAPVKFATNQVNEANRTVERLVSEGEVTNENYPKVLEIAKNIYQKYPKMQKQVDGQAMAIELAVEHYKSIGKATTTTATTQNLKGQINNLKKKTALDTKNVKGGGDKVNLDKLRANAMNGSMRDKEKFFHSDPRVKIDAMIPDYMKG